MKIVEEAVEAKLVDFANSVRNSQESYYAVHFNFSKLSESYKNDFQVKIATNILFDIFREERGKLLRAQNYDLYLVFEGSDKILLNKAIFQLRYLFFDDPLANLPDGTENPEFCKVYDLNFQWSEFFKLCSIKFSESTKALYNFDEDENQEPVISLHLLDKVVREIEEKRLDDCIRNQPICSIKDIKKPKPIFHEIYINIQNLQEKLSTNFKLTGNKWLFKYLTQKLDEKVIETISINPEDYLYMPISINLNISTIFSRDFTEFCEIAKDFKSQIVIEVDIADAFSDIKEFYKARELSHKRNHKICIDGLDSENFIQVSRKKIGFDLAKLRWNGDVKADINKKIGSNSLAEAINNCGANRLILCRCDDIHAVEYGHEFGINLFQGRFADRIIDPNSKVLN